MEILRSSFIELLPEVEEAIKECEFMAIDVEFSGLNPASIAVPRDMADTPQERYLKVRQQSIDFIMCQFGLCTFRWDAKRNEYEAKPFNFYIMPASSGVRGAPERYFQCQASTIDFLARNGFDFAKWLGHGIHFMNWDEEQLFRERRENEIANSMPEMQLDERGLQFEKHARQQIDRWLSTKEQHVHIICGNGYQSRIVYQLIQKCYPSLDADGQRGFIAVQRKNQALLEKRNAQRRAKMEVDVAQAIGFRRIIDMMAYSRKPIVGHHMIMDICQIYHHMYKSLPEHIGTFAAGILSLFPIMFDTKHMCVKNPDVESRFSDTRLEDMYSLSLWPPEIHNISIKCNRHFTRYNQKFCNHEAGYDALVTGIVFIRLYHTLLSENYSDINMVKGCPIFTKDIRNLPPVLSRYVNQLHFVKSSTTCYYDLIKLAQQGDRRANDQEIKLFCRALHL